MKFSSYTNFLFSKVDDNNFKHIKMKKVLKINRSNKILIVDDNALNRKIATILLEDNGYSVELAEDGQEAFTKYQASPENYDAILMDYQMPIMNGIEATKAIRAFECNKKHIPIIALTTEDIKIEPDCLAAGMDDFLEKPIDIIKLIKTLAKFIKN